jgi:hypothetical protein
MKIHFVVSVRPTKQDMIEIKNTRISIRGNFFMSYLLCNHMHIVLNLNLKINFKYGRAASLKIIITAAATYTFFNSKLYGIPTTKIQLFPQLSILAAYYTVPSASTGYIKCAKS